MTDNVTLDLGRLQVEAVPAKAFAGYGGRVYATEAAAMIDLAQNKLANEWLKVCGTGAPPFAQIMSYLEIDPDLAEAAVKLARFKSLPR